MPDWSSPVTLQRAFAGATALMYICIGIFLCETVRYAKFDWSILSGERKRRWPQIPYFFSKICYWTYIVTNLVFVLTVDEISCNGVLQAIEMQMGWITVSSSILLACRTVCVYGGRTRSVISAVLVLMTLGLTAAWMVGVPDGVSDWIPGGGQPWTRGTCGFTSISPHYAIKYVVTIVYDLTVMVLTVIGVVRMNGGSRIGDVLIKQGILYFVATFVINGLVTGLTLAQLNPVMSLCGAIPAATVCVMCSTRLYVDLAEEAKPKNGGVTNSQLSTSGTAEKVAKIFKRSRGRGESARPNGSFGANSTNSDLSKGYKVQPLGYARFGSQTPTEDKSLRHGSAEDLEAQRLKGITVLEDQVIVTEPMPPHLQASHPYSSNSNPNSLHGHYPRLSGGN
ncbi:hypothetical protein IE53DRAFT_390889 [Violaceomyces palustris]|uniref:Uncharacterized protein n=1 Tax=Violaceomyces palustris TaxID=1673888 RepID=A0ACD0NMC9_9BASI|nr:hypothetical protein IE53DRAFT_390889 [Violaceomyces palustris]